MEEGAGVFAFVDAAAGAQVNDVRDDPFLDIAPGLAAIGGFPGQVPGSRVDGVGIAGIDGQGFDFVNLGAAGRADLGPRGTGIAGAIDALEGTGKEDVGIGGRLDEGLYELALEELDFMPGMARIVTDPQAAVVGVLPRAHVQRGGVGGIDDDVVDDEAVAAVELGQAMPGCAFVEGFVEPTVGGAEIKMMGLAGHGGKGARIASVGADDCERGLRMQSRKAEQAQKKGNELDRNAKLAQIQRKRPQTVHQEGELPRFCIQNRQRQGAMAKRSLNPTPFCAELTRWVGVRAIPPISAKNAEMDGARKQCFARTQCFCCRIASRG